MTKEQRLQVFIDGANRFFNEVNKIDVEVCTPYLVENRVPTSHDYTGIIGISGPYRGCVYFTAPQILLRHLLLSMDELDNSEHALLDFTGEIANTIAGNARSEYGEEFMISVPMETSAKPFTLSATHRRSEFVRWQTRKSPLWRKNTYDFPILCPKSGRFLPF